MADNSKRLISNYYDSLVRRVEDYTAEQLKKYNDHDLIKITETKAPEKVEKKTIHDLDSAGLDLLSDELEGRVFDDPIEDESMVSFTARRSGITNERSRPAKAREYLSQVRGELVRELRRIEQETTMNVAGGESSESGVFARGLAVLFARSNNESNIDPAPFELYLVVLDFYLNEYQRKFLK